MLTLELALPRARPSCLATGGEGEAPFRRSVRIIVDRADGGEEVKEEERQAHPREDEVAPFSAETRSHRHDQGHDAIVPEAYTLQSPARGDTHLKVSLPQ